MADNSVADTFKLIVLNENLDWSSKSEKVDKRLEIV